MLRLTYMPSFWRPLRVSYISPLWNTALTDNDMLIFAILVAGEDATVKKPRKLKPFSRRMMRKRKTHIVQQSRSHSQLRDNNELGHFEEDT